MKIEQTIKTYFTAYQDYFWKWDLDKSISSDNVYNTIVLSSSNTTIAYTVQIKEILETLSEKHIPPFGALLLTIIASSLSKYDITSLIVDKEKTKIISRGINAEIKFEEINKFLKNIKELPLNLRQDKNKIHLLYVLFENAPFTISNRYKKAILSNFVAVENNTFKNSSEPISKLLAIKDFHTLYILSKQFPTKESILEALKRVPKIEEEIQLEEDEESKDLVEELCNDPKTFYIGSLVNQLQAGIKLPMVYNQPGEQTLGGISDITNKGNFDRLLLSEFANDDDIFLHRIANNEALYVRRENPPVNDNKTRLLLIDCTIKNWGIPKILSYAVVFAIKEHPKTDIPCKTFLLGANYKKINLNTLKEVINSNKIVSAELDASKGLELFFENFKDDNTEIIFLTSEKTLNHTDVQNVLNKNIDNINYLLSTNTKGELNFYKYQNRNKKHVQNIKLDLQKLWNRVPTKKRLKVPQNIPSNNKEYPLLYGLSSKFSRNFYHKKHFYFPTKKGDIYYVPAIAENKGIYNDKGLEFYNSYPKIQHFTNPSYTFYNEKLVVLDINFNKKQIKLYVEVENKILILENEDNFNFNVSYRLCNHKNQLFIKQLYIQDYSYKIDIENKKVIEYNHEVSTEFKHFPHYARNLLTNINMVSIYDTEEIVFHGKKNNFLLNIYNGSISLDVTFEESDIQPIGTTRKKNKHFFYDGSQIIVNKMGIIEFHSANKDIPTFYLSSFTEFDLAFASEKHFTGNTYFLRESSDLEIITSNFFYELYLKRFMQNIVDHET